jgi:tetratricopeptide (TPR) repeat protein/bacterioferritin-associated ferredoxin
MIVQPTGACLTDEQISEMVEGLLTPEQLSSAEVHLSNCGECRSLVASMMESSVRSTAPAPSALASTFSLQPVDPSHYEVGRELARGGMGRILEGWDCRHHRRVAIKVLLKPGAAAAQRFVREARITARLQHPSIVPLYEAGLWSEGEPFFAMKLVQGRPLSEALAHAETLEARLALLPNIIAVTEALAYAHSENVVHRDLKPSNVLLGDFGETVVIDWGLAKDLGSPELDEPDLAEERRASLTVAGHALGTPCYMPPEQARGELVDPRADVYALGALLYHVFAGRPPFVAGSAEAVLAQVLAGPPESLAKRVPNLAPDLLTIVHKAMERQPADRYASAKAMADDLKRYADGQLVSAHRYSIRALVSRWIARHRAVVAMSAALVMAVTLVGGLSVRRIVRERDRADTLKAAADRERTAAIGQRDAAEELVDFMVGRLKSTLETVGRLDAMEGVGQEVDKYYQRVLPSAGDHDPATLVRRAVALEMLADVEMRKQNRDEAHALSLAANKLRIAELEARPDDSESRSHIANNLLRVATMDVDARSLEDAKQEAREALSVCDTLMAREPQQADWQMLAARAHQRVAKALSALSDTAGALREYQTALDLAQRAAGTNPSDPKMQSQLGYAEFFVAWAEMDRDDLDAAIRGFRASADLLGQASRADPKNTRVRREMTWGLIQVADVERQRGNLSESARAVEEAKGTLDELAKLDPDNREWQRDACVADLKLCEARAAAGLFQPALEACREALPIAQRLSDHDASNATARDDLTHVQWALARVALGLAKPSDAAAYARAAATNAEALLQRDPKGQTPREDQGVSLTWLARAELAQGKLDAARADGDAAVAVLDQRNHDFPEVAAGAYGHSLADAQIVAADIARASGDLGRARSLYEAPVAAYRELVKSKPLNAESRLALAVAAHSMFEVVVHTEGPSAAAVALLDEAIGALEPLRSEHELAPADLRLLELAKEERSR